MDVATGQVVAERIERNDSTHFTRFLAQLDRSTAPALRIHLVMDNGSSHTSRATRAWLAAHPRFTVTHTPKHASWLNMIEQWFSALTRRALRGDDFASRAPTPGTRPGQPHEGRMTTTQRHQQPHRTCDLLH